jgi:Flp pilus assembly protein TadG
MKRTRVNMIRRCKHNNKQSGAILILASFVIVIMLGITALVVDISYLHVVKEEMQNAADSAALRGANFLERDENGKPIPLNTPQIVAINKAISAATTHEVIKQNLAVADLNIRTGYWDWKTSSIDSLRSNTKPPVIEVTVSKNNVALFFARIFGFDRTDLQSKSIAIAPSPDSVQRGALKLPLVISECVFLGLQNQNNDPVYIGISAPGDCTPQGAWGTIESNLSKEEIQDIITGQKEQPDAIVGLNVTVTTDVDADSFRLVDDCRISTSCKYAILPVLSTIKFNSPTSADNKINGFACVEIKSVKSTGNPKYVEISRASGCQSGFFTGLPGPNYGVYVPSKLIF